MIFLALFLSLCAHFAPRVVGLQNAACFGEFQNLFLKNRQIDVRSVSALTLAAKSTSVASCLEEFLQRDAAEISSEAQILRFLREVFGYKTRARFSTACSIYNSYLHTREVIEQIAIVPRVTIEPQQGLPNVDVNNANERRKLEGRIELSNGAQTALDNALKAPCAAVPLRSFNVAANVFDAAEAEALDRLARNGFARFVTRATTVSSLQISPEQCGCVADLVGSNLMHNESVIATITRRRREEAPKGQQQRSTFVYGATVHAAFSPDKAGLAISKDGPFCQQAVAVRPVELRQLVDRNRACVTELSEGKTYLLSGRFVSWLVNQERKYAFDTNPCAYVREIDYLRFANINRGNNNVEPVTAWLPRHLTCFSYAPPKNSLQFLDNLPRSLLFPEWNSFVVEFTATKTGSFASQEDVLRGVIEPSRIATPLSALAYQVYRALWIGLDQNILYKDLERNIRTTKVYDGDNLIYEYTAGKGMSDLLTALSTIADCQNLVHDNTAIGYINAASQNPCWPRLNFLLRGSNQGGPVYTLARIQTLVMQLTIVLPAIPDRYAYVLRRVNGDLIAEGEAGGDADESRGAKFKYSVTFGKPERSTFRFFDVKPEGLQRFFLPFESGMGFFFVSAFVTDPAATYPALFRRVFNRPMPMVSTVDLNQRQRCAALRPLQRGRTYIALGTLMVNQFDLNAVQDDQQLQAATLFTLRDCGSIIERSEFDAWIPNWEKSFFTTTRAQAMKEFPKMSDEQTNVLRRKLGLNGYIREALPQRRNI